MDYKIVTDALVIPAIEDFRGGSIHGVEVKCGKVENNYLTLTRKRESILKEDLRRTYLNNHPPRRERLKGTYLYVGAFPSHFGHLVAEGVHRLWITRAL